MRFAYGRGSFALESAALLLCSSLMLASPAPVHAAVTLIGGGDFRIDTITEVGFRGKTFDAKFHYGASFAELVSFYDEVGFSGSADAASAEAALIAAIGDGNLITGTTPGLSTVSFGIPFGPATSQVGSTRAVRIESVPLEFIAVSTLSQLTATPLESDEAWVTFTPRPVDLEWVMVDSPGNLGDPNTNCRPDFGNGCGVVSYLYEIGKHEVTNAQYAEFLNAVDPMGTNTLGLYGTDMGITDQGVGQGFIYQVQLGFTNKPVAFVSWYDAARFANWLHNGKPTGTQGPGATEDGAYTITPVGIAANSITRNVGARVFLPSEDEWYKAAYYDAALNGGLGGYYDYPARSDDETACAAPGAAPNTANCSSGGVTAVGSYPGSPSPWGTFDQGGNLFEWSEAIIAAVRLFRGGSWNLDAGWLAFSAAPGDVPTLRNLGVGFRVARRFQADLSVTVSDDPDPVLAGSLLTYTVRVDAAGPDAARNVRVSTGASYLPLSVVTSGCDEDPNGVGSSCTLGDIPAGGFREFTVALTFDPTAIGTVTASAGVASDTFDPNPANNQATETTGVASDGDGDGIPDDQDNCTTVPNPLQENGNAGEDDDSSLAGVQLYGDVCDVDLDNDGIVGSSDFFGVLRPCFGADLTTRLECVVADLDGDGVVGASDFFGSFRPAIGSAPGRGLSCIGTSPCTAQETRIDAVFFSDPLLGDCVRAVAAANGWVFADDVTALDCAQTGIRLLGGVERFFNLQALDLTGTDVYDVARLAELGALETLNLSSMPNLDGVQALLPLSGLTALDVSGSGDGRIACRDLDTLVGNGVSVTRPDACRKPIADVVFADAAVLACIMAAADLAQATFTDEIRHLDCSFDPASFPTPIFNGLDGLQNFQNLESINLTRQKVIGDLTPLSGLPRLRAIDATSLESLTSLSPLGQAPALQELILRGALIDPAEIQVLSNIPTLTAVYIDDLIVTAPGLFPNRIVTGGGFIDCLALDTLAAGLEAFGRPSSCDMLIRDVIIPDLNLRFCVDIEVFAQGYTRTTELEDLDCSFKGIARLDGLERFAKLRNVDLEGNPIDDLGPLSQAFNLERFNVSGTNIRNFSALSALPAFKLLSVRAENIPGLFDLTTLTKFSILAEVYLSGSGSILPNNISCADVASIEGLVNSEGGDFSAPQTCSNQPTVPRTRTSDIDADGDDDLVLEFAPASAAVTASWRLSLADSPVFSDSSVVPGFAAGTYSRARAIGLADANSDGRDDVLFQLNSASDGTVSWRVRLSDGSGFVGEISRPGGNDARAVAFNDIDNDGFADILIQEQRNGFIDYFWSKGGLFTNPSTGNEIAYFSLIPLYSFDLSLGRPQIIALEDINNDGTADLVLDLELGDRHCFVARVFRNGAFEPPPSASDCHVIQTPPNWVVSVAGVADLDGDESLELVYSLKLSENRRLWDFLSLTDGSSGSKWKYGSTIIEETGAFAFRTIAVTDLNEDGRADVLIEFTAGQNRTWVAHLALPGGGGFERQEWLTGLSSYRTLGLRDYDNDGRPDLLLEIPDNTTGDQRLYAQANQGTSFSNSFPVWRQDSENPRVVGIEEDGLTFLAHEMSDLVLWTGLSDTPRYTPNEFREMLGTKGMTLKPPSSTAPLKKDECEMSWTKATGPQAGFGGLICRTQDLGAGVTLKMQGIYGGCGLNKDTGFTPDTVMGFCSAGVFREEFEFKISTPIGEVTNTVEAGFLNAEACRSVSLSGGPLCLGADATVVSVSRTVSINKTGVGAGVSVGVGLGGSANVEDGVISGSFDIKGGLGVSVEFSLNYEAVGSGAVDGAAEAGDFLVRNGEDAFVFVGNNAETGVVAAGEAIYDSVEDLGGVTETFAGDAVAFAGDATQAIAVVVRKDSILGLTADAVFLGVEAGLAAIGGVVEGAGAVIIDVGSGIGSGVGAGATFVGDLFGF